MSDAALVSAPGVLGRRELAEFVGAGGRRLRYAVVRAHPERRALLYLHGIESHGGWFEAAAERLAERGCTTYLLDRRGSGLNRALEPGHAASAAELLEDVRRFRAHAGLERLVLVGLSWGGKLALATALDEPRGVCALVLVTPGLVPRIEFSRSQRLGIALALAVGGRARFHVPIAPEMFTRTPRYLDYIVHDPLRLERVSARFLLASRALDRRIRAGVSVLEPPVLLLLAGHDRIVDNDRTRRLLEAAPPGRLRVRTYENATHSIQFEETDAMVDDIERFLEDVRC
jgi:alpha-beta hydrolase superfamily lysophospholipase